MPELVTPPTSLILWAIVGYLLGSIPFGMIFARIMGLGSLRDIGSGNIGATNVLRTGNKTAAALTLFFDAGKGALIILLARALAGEDAAQLAGVSAIIGHCFPVWLSFRGGKGVATYFGLMITISPVVGLTTGVIWILIAAGTRYSSLAALVAALWAVLIVALVADRHLFVLTFILAVLIYARHHTNIKRLRAGEEPKIQRS